MTLSQLAASDTSADVGKRQRTLGPSVKLNGVPVPKHVRDLMDEIVKLQTAAYKKMGGTTKVSFSDELAEAMRGYVEDFIERHGPLPEVEADREQYVERLAEANRRDLRESINRLVGGSSSLE